MTELEYAADLQMRYDAEIAAGGKIEIDSMLPTVDIRMSNGDEYSFQEHEASELLDSVPDYLNEEVFILCCAQNW